MAGTRRHLATEKELKQRLGSVRSIQKITRASKMVAAAKLRGVQSALETARPFCSPMLKIWEEPDAAEEQAEETQVGAAETSEGEEPINDIVYVAVTADRGLCGGVNSAIMKAVRAEALEARKASTSFRIMTVGERGRSALVRGFGKDFSLAITEASKALVPSYETALALGELLHTAHRYRKAVFIFNKFKSAIAYDTVQEEMPSIEHRLETKAMDGYEFEGDEKEIKMNLAEFTSSVQFYRMLLENGTTEQSQRMAAMESSTKNAGELIDKLNLQYNRSRQARITTELIEIISGAAALD